MTRRPAPNLSAALALLAVTALGGTANAFELVLDDTSVRAVDQGRELWEHEHHGLQRADGRRPGHAWGLEGPVRLDELVAWSAADQLYVADAATGAIVDRVPLPERPGRLEAGDGVVLVHPPDGGWSGAVDTTWRIAPLGEHDVPYVSHLAARYVLRDDAERFVLDAAAAHMDRSPAASWEHVLSHPRWRPALAAIRPALRERAERDPTNPWLHVALARVELSLGRPDDARAALERATRVDLRWAEELVDAAFDVQLLALPEADAVAHEMLERGARAMYARGFAPASACIPHMDGVSRDPHTSPPSGPPPRDALARARLDAQRTWWLYPTCNDVARRFLGVSHALRAAGDPDGADLWLARAEASEREAERVGPLIERPDPDHTRAGLARAAALAAILSALVLALELLRTTAGRRSATTLTPGTLPRGELILIALLCLPVLEHAGRPGWNDISHTEVARDAWLGAPGAPTLRRHLEDASTLPGGRFALALHLLHAGELERADALFAELTHDARAVANRGVIAARRGLDADARALFEHALALEPDLVEAAAALGRPHGPSLRPPFDNAVRGASPGPVPARPEHAHDAWIAVALTDGLAPEPDAVTHARVPLDVGEPPWTTLLPAMGAAALLLAALPRRGPRIVQVPSRRRCARIARALIPGASSALRGIRPLLWFAVIALVQAAVAWWSSAGATINPFDVYREPVPPFGSSGRLQAPLPLQDRTSVVWSFAWLALLLAHAALVVRIERRRSR